MKPIKPQKLEDIKIKGHNTFIKMGRASDNGILLKKQVANI